MDLYTSFDIRRVSQLTVIKKGIFHPSFEMTDEAYTYGKLYFKGWFKRIGYIDTADGNWTIKQKKWYCNDVVLTDAMGQVVATTKTNVWSGKVVLTFTDGISLQYRCNGWFSKIQSSYSEAYGTLLNIEIKIWSNKRPFIISFEPVITKTSVNPLLLAFMGVHVIYVRRAQAAAAAAGN